MREKWVLNMQNQSAVSFPGFFLDTAKDAHPTFAFTKKKHSVLSAAYTDIQSASHCRFEISSVVTHRLALANDLHCTSSVNPL